MFSIIQLAVFAGTENKLLKMCKTEKKKLCVLLFFGTERFKKSVIVVYSFQKKKNVYYSSWELNFKKRVLPIKIIGVIQF